MRTSWEFDPILLQCALSAVCMVVFYFKYQDRLAENWTPDAMEMCVVYVVSAMFVFSALCKLTGQQFASLQKSSEESNKAREKAESLLGEIKKSGGVSEGGSKVRALNDQMQDLSEKWMQFQQR